MFETKSVSRVNLDVAPEVSDEDRIYARFITNAPVQLKEPHAPAMYTATCKDISAGGARIRTNKQFRLGDLVDLFLTVPSCADPLHLTGNVRWLKESGFTVWDAGVEFKDVNFMDLAPLFRV